MKPHIEFFLLLCLAASFSCGGGEKTEGVEGAGFELPGPTGPFAVGTTWLYFTDSERPETFTANPDDHRELAVRVWYPADTDTGRSDERCFYVEHTAMPLAKGLTEDVRSALERLNERLSSIRTHSYRDARMAASGGPFPIILYSHGYWAGMNQSTVLMEELASHGYIAASIGHSYETNSVTKPDGSVIRFDPRNPEFMLRGAERQKALPMERAMVQTTDPGELDSFLREIIAVRPKQMESIGIWADDISFVIDMFEELDRSHEIFKGNCDLERIGVVGHSFGGSASGEVCMTDERIGAGINMDGLQVGAMIDTPIGKPIIFMHHDNLGALNKTPNLNMFRRAEGPAYLIVIQGTGHYNFSDFSLSMISEVVPQPEGALGNIDGQRCITILNDCVVAFFNVYLRGEEIGSLKKVFADYPEIAVDARNIEN